MSSLRVLVVDDHPIFRFGLCELIRAHAGWEVCGEAADGRTAVLECARLRPDLLIMDICMPRLNGVDAARQILKQNPDQRVLVVTDVRAERVIQDCLEAGVRGWVFKSDGIDELTAAIEALQQNKTTFSQSICDVILDGYLGRRTLIRSSAAKLSSREREVVQLVAEGRSSKELASILNISVKTAETHRSNVLLKLNLHSTVDVVLYAVRNEIIHVHLPSRAPVEMSSAPLSQAS